MTTALRLLRRATRDWPAGPIVGLCVGVVLGLALAAVALGAVR